MTHHRCTVLLSTLTVASALLAPSLAAATPLTFPTRADALPDGTLINTRGHIGNQYAVDYGRLRWDPTVSEWVHWWEGASQPYTLDDNTTFGTPLYAPEDGYVVACFRNTVDSPGPSVDQCAGGCPNDIFAAGNFLVIRSMDDDHAVLLAHLQYDTIPESLCPNPNTVTNNAASACGIAGWGDYPDNTHLHEPFPLVERGDYLGDIGMTGASGAPHGHVEVHPLEFDANGRPCRDVGQPIEWYESFYQLRFDGVAPTTQWTPMNGHVVTNGTPIVIIPDPIGVLCEDHDYGHGASDLNLTTHTLGEVAAYRDGAGQLDLRSFTLNAQGFATQQDLVDEGAVLDVALTRPNSSRAVIASIRGTNGKLKLIPYAVANNGQITRQYGKEVTEGNIGRVAATRSPAHDGIVVAVKDGAGVLKVIDYHVSAALTITRNTSSSGTGGSIDDVAVAPLTRGFQGVITAERTAGTGVLRLRSFAVPAAGGVVNADTYTAFLAGTEVDVDVVPVGFGLDEYVVSTLRLGDGSLRLDVWDVDASGEIAWVTSGSAGSVSALDSAVMGDGDLLTSVRDASGDLRMIGWSLDLDGALRRNATHIFDPITEVRALPSASSPGHIVALTRDGGGSLVLNSFDENFSWGI